MKGLEKLGLNIIICAVLDILTLEIRKQINCKFYSLQSQKITKMIYNVEE